MDEVEEAVLGGFEPGNKSGPSDGALRRGSGTQTLEVACIAKLSEIRQIGPVALHEGGIHAVHAEYDQLGFVVGLARNQESGRESEEDYGAEA